MSRLEAGESLASNVRVSTRAGRCGRKNLIFATGDPHPVESRRHPPVCIHGSTAPSERADDPRTDVRYITDRLSGQLFHNPEAVQPKWCRPVVTRTGSRY
jgi:hypothetical protein